MDTNPAGQAAATPADAVVYVYDRHTTPNADALRRRLEACSAYARDQGWDIGGWWVDKGDDALSSDTRPALDMLLRTMGDARDGTPRMLLIYDWDRLHSSSTVQAKYRYHVAEAGGVTVTTFGGNDSISPSRGRLSALARTA